MNGEMPHTNSGLPPRPPSLQSQPPSCFYTLPFAFLHPLPTLIYLYFPTLFPSSSFLNPLSYNPSLPHLPLLSFTFSASLQPSLLHSHTFLCFPSPILHFFSPLTVFLRAKPLTIYAPTASFLLFSLRYCYVPSLHPSSPFAFLSSCLYSSLFLHS